MTEPPKKPDADKATKPKKRAPPKSNAAKPFFARKRGGEARVISDLLPDIGRAAFRRYGFVQSSVVSRWHEIVGATYADVSVPQAIRFPRGERVGGVLELLVSGAYAPQLQAVSPEIITRVNRFFGYNAVMKIKLVHGQLPPAETRKPKPRQAPPSLRPVSFEVGDGLRAIADPELGAVLQALAAEIDARDAANDAAREAEALRWNNSENSADPFANLPKIS